LSPSGAEELRDGLTTVTRGTALVTVSAVCLVVFTFFSRVLLVRTPAADWNSFSLELSIAAILVTIGTLGLPNAVARSLPHTPSDPERRTIVTTAIVASLGSALSLAVGLWIAAPYIAQALGIPDLTIGLEFFSISISTALLAGLIAAIFRGFADVIPNALFIQTLNPGLFLAFILVALEIPAIGLRYTTALAAYAAANGVTLLLLVLYAARRLPGHLPPGVDSPESRGRLLRFTAPLFLSAVMLTLAGTGDTLILGVYHSAQVGVYTASLTLARLVVVGVGSASYIFLPVATRLLRRESPHGVKVMYATITKWLLTLSVPLFLLFEIFPHRSLGFVYGPSYTAVVLPLQLTVAGAFSSTLLGPAAATQIAYGQVRLVAINSVAAGALDVGLALILVPGRGSVGAAIAWSAATLAYAALSLLELAVTERLHPFSRDYGIPLVVTVVPVGFVLWATGGRIPQLALPLVGLAVAAIFVLVVFLTRSIDEGDRLLLGAIESIIGRPVPLVRRLSRRSRRS
jgi:O-antigen/teichoic acid export membrane protein